MQSDWAYFYRHEEAFKFTGCPSFRGMNFNFNNYLAMAKARERLTVRK
jgi:hypothetical protein